MRLADQGGCRRNACWHRHADAVKARRGKVRDGIGCRGGGARSGRTSRSIDFDAGGLAGSHRDRGDRGRRRRMTVYFIGAGPGAPDLLTLRGRDLIAAADVVIFADSLVDPEVCSFARPGAEIIGSSTLTLEEITQREIDAARGGKIVARLQSGDPAV